MGISDIVTIAKHAGVLCTKQNVFGNSKTLELQVISGFVNVAHGTRYDGAIAPQATIIKP